MATTATTSDCATARVMGKGGARLVTTRRRNFSISEGTVLDGLARTLSVPGTDADGAAAGLSAGLTADAIRVGVGAEGTGVPACADGRWRRTRQLRSKVVRARAYFVERANASVYLACAIAFAPASLGFLPGFKEQYALACWVFIVGSAGFLWVACCDTRETWKLHKREGGEMAQVINCVMYVIGSLLFIVGSFLFLPGATTNDKTWGAWFFIVGSAAFTLAAFLNVTEVRRNTELDVEQAKLCITVCYFGGGVLFVVGSACFLPALPECLEPLGAWLFVFGSALYIGGAVINFVKISLEESSEAQQDGDDGPGDPSGAGADDAAGVIREATMLDGNLLARTNTAGARRSVVVTDGRKSIADNPLVAPPRPSSDDALVRFSCSHKKFYRVEHLMICICDCLCVPHSCLTRLATLRQSPARWQWRYLCKKARAA